jgi:hypothetical protein
MNKYIQDSVRNNLRSIVRNMTKPQQKSIQEITRGLFVSGTPILRHLIQDESKTAKKQAEKYSHHLGNVELKERVDKFTFRKAKQSVNSKTIIAYDLTDISKEAAKKMKKLGRVFDGSRRKVTNGYTLHGVGINNLLVKLETHDSETKTLNQTRRKIVKGISEQLDRNGIWVFDRGNDNKQFFKDLQHNLKVNFIARLRSNRQVVMAKTGVIIQVKDVPVGKYEVFLMNYHNIKVDTRFKFTLIIREHLKNKEPIRLLSNLDSRNYSSEKFTTMYLERWGVENIFKRIKTKFELEKIRVLSYEKYLNLVALIQFAVVVSTLIFNHLHKVTNSLITSVILMYKRFLKFKNLTFNIDSFISYMRVSLTPLLFRKPPLKNQPSLFSRRCLEKLGTF